MPLIRGAMYSVVLVTASHKKEADMIARALVSQRLAACVNSVGAVESLFRWEGRIDKAKEVLLIIKTKKSLVGRLIRQVKAMHSYEVPEIIALPVIAGNKDYLGWIHASTR